MNYPKWMYHRTEPAALVQDPDEQACLGGEWAETPAAFEQPEEAGKPAATRKRK